MSLSRRSLIETFFAEIYFKIITSETSSLSVPEEYLLENAYFFQSI
jgi:hypothetical protein